MSFWVASLYSGGKRARRYHKRTCPYLHRSLPSGFGAIELASDQASALGLVPCSFCIGAP